MLITPSFPKSEEKEGMKSFFFSKRAWSISLDKMKIKLGNFKKGLCMKETAVVYAHFSLWKMSDTVMRNGIFIHKQFFVGYHGAPFSFFFFFSVFLSLKRFFILRYKNRKYRNTIIHVKCDEMALIYILKVYVFFLTFGSFKT